MRSIHVDKAHCLFEQSGTWKNEFIKIGIPAEDYDILDDFGETDHVVDLFGEIEKAYRGESSLFDSIGSNDLVIAFFPCTRFEAQVTMFFNGNHYSIRDWSDEEKLRYVIGLHGELHNLYDKLCKLFAIANLGGWRMIVENPWHPTHYLVNYFPIKPALIDRDRRENGDYYKKPTQYWFVNCKPEQYMPMEPLEWVETMTVENADTKTHGMNRTVLRSLMHPQYARRFILSYITEGGENL